MREDIRRILQLQDIDMKILQLVKVKRTHRAELDSWAAQVQSWIGQAEDRYAQLIDLRQHLAHYEQEIKLKENEIHICEMRQASVKKADEFSALTREMVHLEKKKEEFGMKSFDISESIGNIQDELKGIKENLKSMSDHGKALQEEVSASINLVNQEGRELQDKREEVKEEISGPALGIYNRLFANKTDRVVVPLESKICSGCHIALTPQHENLVRRDEHIVFCEHCARILYIPDVQEDEKVTRKPRVRRTRVRSAE